MSDGVREVLACGRRALAVRCDDPRDLAWLREFLCPWFEPRGADAPADASIELVTSREAHAAARARGPLAGAAPCAAFLADGPPLALEPWGEGPEGELFYDARSDAFLERASGGTRWRVLAPPGQRFARVVWMRAIRELALEGLLADGRPLLHAAAVAWRDRAILFAGPRRAGKSSCLLHALHAPGAALLANDRVAILPGAVRGVPTIVRLRAGAFARYPELAERAHSADFEVSDAIAEDDAGRPRFARPGGGVGLSPGQLLHLLRAPARAEAPLAALVLPHVTQQPGGFRLARVPAGEAATRLGSARLFPVSPPATLFSGPRSRPDADAGAAWDRLTGEAQLLDCALDLDAFAGEPAKFLDEILAACS